MSMCVGRRLHKHVRPTFPLLKVSKQKVEVEVHCEKVESLSLKLTSSIAALMNELMTYAKYLVLAGSQKNANKVFLRSVRSYPTRILILAAGSDQRIKSDDCINHLSYPQMRETAGAFS